MLEMLGGCGNMSMGLCFRLVISLVGADSMSQVLLSGVGFLVSA
jgi:hypothetical protein